MRSLIFLLLFSSQAFASSVTYLFSGQMDVSWHDPTLTGFAVGDDIDLYITYDADDFTVQSNGYMFDGQATSNLMVNGQNFFQYENHTAKFHLTGGSTYFAFSMNLNNHDSLPQLQALDAFDAPYYSWWVGLGGYNTSGLTQDLSAMVGTPQIPHGLCVIRNAFEYTHIGDEEKACVQINSISIANPVPLPAGIYLFLSGLVGLGLVRGRNA